MFWGEIAFKQCFTLTVKNRQIATVRLQQSKIVYGNDVHPDSIEHILEGY